MKTDFTEQAHAETCRVVGAAVVQLVARGEPDLAVEFALDLLR